MNEIGPKTADQISRAIEDQLLGLVDGRGRFAEATTNSLACDDKPFGLADLEAMLALVGKVPPDPLKGADRLVCCREMVTDAYELANLVNNPNALFPRVRIDIHEHAPPGFIFAMRGLECVAVIGPEKTADAECARPPAHDAGGSAPLQIVAYRN